MIYHFEQNILQLVICHYLDRYLPFNSTKVKPSFVQKKKRPSLCDLGLYITAISSMQ